MTKSIQSKLNTLKQQISSFPTDRANRRIFSKAFKKEVHSIAKEIGLDNHPIAQISTYLEIMPQTLGKWVRGTQLGSLSDNKHRSFKTPSKDPIYLDATGSIWGSTGFMIDLRTKARAVMLIIEYDASISDIANDVGKTELTIRNWVQKYSNNYISLLNAPLGVMWAMEEEKWLFQDDIDTYTQEAVEYAEEIGRLADKAKEEADILVEKQQAAIRRVENIKKNNKKRS